MTTSTLTDGDILAAAANGTASYELCWRTFGPPGAERDAARAEIAELIRQEHAS